MAKTLINVLNDLQLKQFMKGKDPIHVCDGQKLWFTLSKAGTASWTFVYRKDNKKHELTIGNYPEIGLKDARNLAAGFRTAVALGGHPAKDKAEGKRQSKAIVWTTATLAEDYRKKRLVPGEEYAENTVKYRNYDLDNVVIPRLGRRPVAEVTGADVVQMLLEQGDTWTISKRVLTTTKKLFDHAAGLKIVTTNPCAGIEIRSLFGKRPPVKTRVMLSNDDLRKLLAEVDTLGTQNSLALRLLLFTCVRTSELVEAEWKEFDLANAVWEVPDERTKTRTGFVVPLSPPVVQWLEELKVISGGSRYVLPARDERRDGKPITTRTLWAAIDRAFDAGRLTMTKFTPHDVRSTGKGHMAELGIPDHISELVLGHALTGMQAIYDVSKKIPQKRDALNRYAEFLLSLAPAIQ